MGFSIADRFFQGKYFSFYVWFIDRADGPVWRTMRHEFEWLDQMTAHRVAFFVDPFQKTEWAKDFLTHTLGGDDALCAQVLAAREEAQSLFQNTLAKKACEALWLPVEQLPIALVGLHWKARTALAVPLGSNDVRDFLWSLVQLSGEDPWSDTKSRGYRRRLGALQGRLEESGHWNTRQVDLRTTPGHLATDVKP